MMNCEKIVVDLEKLAFQGDIRGFEDLFYDCYKNQVIREYLAKPEVYRVLGDSIRIDLPFAIQNVGIKDDECLFDRINERFDLLVPKRETIYQRFKSYFVK